MTRPVTFFLADDGVHGREIWSTDGTSAGTAFWIDLVLGPTGSGFNLVGLTPTLALTGFQGATTNVGSVYTNRYNYYSTDGQFGGYSGTLTAVSGLGPGSWVDATGLGNGRALVELFLPNGDGRSALFGTDGNQSVELASSIFGMSLQTIAPGIGYAYDSALHRGILTDGTPAGTRSITQSAVSAPAPLAGGQFIFSADDAPMSGQPGLWVGDGTTNTLLLANFSGTNFTTFGSGRVLFAGTDAAHGTELWITDGTLAGTGLVADLNSFPLATYSANPRFITDLGNGRAVLYANTGSLATDSLVVTDGTPGGTDSRTMHYIGPDGFTAIGGGRAVFSGQPGFFDDELWVTDGTLAGTLLVKDIYVGGNNSAPHSFHATGDGHAIFIANDGVHGDEPWITDGTAAGTFLLADIMPGAASSSAFDFVTLQLPGGPQTATGYGQTLNGTNGPDTLNSPYGSATLNGGGGNDVINAGGWGNTITGGPGNDTIEGGEGNARIDGGSGNNVIHVSGWSDVITAGDGQNTVSGPQGNATVTLGNGGNTVLLAGWGNVITTGDGADFIQSGQGGAVVDAGGGDNIIQAWGWRNSITVGDGNNSIEDFDGGTAITAGHGNNTIGLHGWNNTVNLGQGHNQVVVAFGGNTSITAGNGGNIIELSGWNNVVTTGSGDDQVFAGMGLSHISTDGGNDEIWLGGSGSSWVDAGTGNDVIRTGGAWYDMLIGGAGDDTYVVTNATAQIVELAGGGIDTVYVGVDGFAMPAEVEVVRLYGAATQFVGGNGNDIIVGNQAAGSMLAGGAGNDTLYGSAFADVFTGGTGDDLMLSGGGADRFVFATGWGHDVIGGWISGSLLDFRGTGLVFDDLAIAGGAGFTLVTLGADSIQVYGAAGLTAAEFLFG